MNGSFGGGDGSTGNPYLIEDALDLDAIRNNLSKAYKLIKNIDLNIAPYNIGEGWNPIGDTSTPFKGIFNGNAHIIKNLYINRPSTNCIGLFGYISASTIKNTGILNANITGLNNIGGLVGAVYNSSTVANSYSTGNITGKQEVGGLVGDNYCNNNYCHIRFCYSTCKIIYNSYSGGLVGDSYDSTTVINSYWDKETSGISTSAGGTGLTTAQMKTASSFAGWNTQMLDDGVTPVWILKNGDYPKLCFEIAPKKYLIKDGSNIESTSDGIGLTTYAQLSFTIDLFDQYGMNSLSLLNNDLMNNLVNDKYNIALLV